MDFFIRAGASLPVLAVQIVEDGINNYLEFFREIQNANILFTMEDVNNCANKVFCRPAEVIEVPCCETCPQNDTVSYQLVYKWRKNDTKRKGTFKGYFTIDLLNGCGKLIAPIKEDLLIRVI